MSNLGLSVHRYQWCIKMCDVLKKPIPFPVRLKICRFLNWMFLRSFWLIEWFQCVILESFPWDVNGKYTQRERILMLTNPMWKGTLVFFCFIHGSPMKWKPKAGFYGANEEFVGNIKCLAVKPVATFEVRIVTLSLGNREQNSDFNTLSLTQQHLSFGILSSWWPLTFDWNTHGLLQKPKATWSVLSVVFFNTGFSKSLPSWASLSVQIAVSLCPQENIVVKNKTEQC